ncbi:hypothetical protein V8J82_14115 [Gymnodinialimonas sp. 2305UL16-5]|uniref:hypothetical protein n=1 Tax=Gymnodinialimonas mytili TaxID=3126503 RepID=UPI0030A6CCEE
MTALTILAHEIAHYLGAVAMGAQNVALHWADITFDETTLDDRGLAVTWMAGPLLTHAIILLVWLSGTSRPAALSLGLGACSRDILLLPFTVKSLLGRDTSGFSSDEVQVSQALGIGSLPLAALAVILGVGGLIWFLLRAYHKEGVSLVIALVTGTVAGFLLWTYVGPILLPGGRGYD